MCKYLTHLLNVDHSSIDDLASILGLDAKCITREIEPALMTKGLIRKTQHGRLLTPAGRSLATTNAQKENP